MTGYRTTRTRHRWPDGTVSPHLRCTCGWLSEPIDGDTDEEVEGLAHDHHRDRHQEAA